MKKEEITKIIKKYNKAKKELSNIELLAIEKAKNIENLRCPNCSYYTVPTEIEDFTSITFDTDKKHVGLFWTENHCGENDYNDCIFPFDYLWKDNYLEIEKVVIIELLAIEKAKNKEEIKIRKQQAKEEVEKKKKRKKASEFKEYQRLHKKFEKKKYQLN